MSTSLPLSLLVFYIFTNNENFSFSLNCFTLVADFFY